MDATYLAPSWGLSELPHRYGDNVHLLADPMAFTELARLCSPGCEQPEFNQIVARLYDRLLWAAINHEAPRTRRRVETRMMASTPRAVVEGEMIDPSTRVVVVDIARAGILPAQVVYDRCNVLFDPSRVRQDHLIMARVTDADGHVTGSEIHGGKVGGDVDGSLLIIPDPMGATGGSVARTIDHYLATWDGHPERIVALHLIITPEYLRTMRQRHPDARIYALRLDRGMSADDVLQTTPGERWDEERGLNDIDYIVPGGGGFGELMNNSWV